MRGGGVVDGPTAHAGLAVFGVDERGLDKVDRAVLNALCARFGGGPVGLKTLAISVGEPEETVEDVYEPFLIQQGLLMRTHRGRVATPAAWAHLGLEPPANAASEAAPGLVRLRPTTSWTSPNSTTRCHRSAIAQEPVEPRDAARLLVDRGPDAAPEHHAVADLPELLRPGDLLVVNDSRVRAARLHLRKPTGGEVEVLLLEPVGDGGR